MTSLCDVASEIESATETIRSFRAAHSLLHTALEPAVPIEGYTVSLDPTAPDGTVRVCKRMWTIHLGTRPLTELELVAHQARHIVRSGLADVLDWLGEDVGPARPPNHYQLLTILRGAR